MSTRVFASDFDGTLYFMHETPRMRDDDLAAIEGFRASGGLFGVCTGRSLTGVDFAIDAFHPEELGRAGSHERCPVTFDFYILASGALVLDRDRRPLAIQRIPPQVSADICQRFDGRCSSVIQANDTVYTFGPTLPMQVHIDDVDQIGPDVYGVSLGTSSRADAHAFADEINRDFGDVVCAYENVRNVDVAPRGCSKGSALASLRQLLGAGCIGAIGDSFNDLPMLREADAAYMMASAPDEVQKHALALGPHGEVVDGVAQALDRFGRVTGI